MKASEARKLSHGKSYADYAVERVLSVVRHQARMGYSSMAFYFTGPYAIDQIEYEKTGNLLKKLGYVWEGDGRYWMNISWKSSEDTKGGV